MKLRARAPKPAALGPVGADHLHRVVDGAYTIDGRSWYKQTSAVVDGIPWLIEAFLAETERPGKTHHLLNHSPVSGDPTAEAYMCAGDVIQGYGTGGLLNAARVDNADHAAVVHIICPAPTFTNRGKTALVVPREVAKAAAAAVWAVAKTVYREEVALSKEVASHARRAARQREAAKPAKVTLRDAVFAVMQQAVRQAGAPDIPYGCRTLYYQIRPLVQQHTAANLTYAWYNTLLTKYQQANGELPGLYYEARGNLVEPHSRTEVPMGTREVAGYRTPAWEYDKVLYVEKTGLRPVLDAAHLGQRYDMAIVYGNGYASAAARELVARIQRGHRFKVFVLHDADPAGYEIARTFAEATARLPDHDIEVIDLGLTVAAAVDRGLESETFTREKNLQSTLRLDPREAEWFEGVRRPGYGKPTWDCRRVELNAFSSPALIEYIEAGLKAHGADGKVVPPDDVLTARAALGQRAALDAKLDVLIADAVDRDALLDVLIVEFATVPPDGLAADDAALHELDRSALWSRAITRRVNSDYSTAADIIRERFTELLAEHLRDGVE